MRKTPARATPFWKDSLLLAAERIARQVYWGWPWLRHRVKRRRPRRRSHEQAASRGDLKQCLREIGVKEGALAMAHTSVSGLKLTEPASLSQLDAISTAQTLVSDLLDLVGTTGTLVMPTHPIYQLDNEYAGWIDPPAVYDPQATPCSTGLANELFWRRPGVLRSLHPFNSLAAYGPLASELLADNLNQSKPLPHGVHSGYYRFCQRNGLVISIGVPLAKCMTVFHTAEDVRDEEWPIKDFFEEREYILQQEGRRKTCVVRQARRKYAMFCLCARKMYRDLRGAGVLHEGAVGGIRVDWARTGEVFQFLMARNRDFPYPYYCSQFVRRGK